MSAKEQSGLRLHSISLTGIYQVENLPLLVRYNKPGWELRQLPGELSPQAGEWLKTQRLRGRFRSRRDLLHLLEAALAREPLPSHSPSPPLVRLGPGRYRSGCGRVLVEGARGHWILAPAPGWEMEETDKWWLLRAFSLRDAAFRASRLCQQLRTTP